MKKSLFSILTFTMFAASSASNMQIDPVVHIPEPVYKPVSTQYSPKSGPALSQLGSALKNDAGHLAYVAQKTTQSWYQATKQACINTHKTAQNGTISMGNGITYIGEWIKSHPNITMIVAAAAVIGYSAYKIDQLYQTYKRGKVHRHRANIDRHRANIAGNL